MTAPPPAGPRMTAAVQRGPRGSGGAAFHEPPPQPGRETVLHHVVADLQARAEAGREKYGMYLQTNNGRDALMDAYQEALDLCMYLKQALLERDAP